jgi:cold shock CspA family protein
VRGYGFVITTKGEEIFAHASEFMDFKTTVGPPEIG